MRSWLLALVVLIVFPTAALAQRPDVLAGLGSVNVIVENLSQDARDAGLSEEGLKTAVELRLRQSGIRVLEDSDPWLYVQLTVASNEVGTRFVGYGYGLNVKLHETGFFQRHVLEAATKTDVDTTTVGEFFEDLFSYSITTWQRNGLGHTGRDGYRALIRNDILEFVDEFANDYLAANPR